MSTRSDSTTATFADAYSSLAALLNGLAGVESLAWLHALLTLVILGPAEICRAVRATMQSRCQSLGGQTLAEVFKILESSVSSDSLVVKSILKKYGDEIILRRNVTFVWGRLIALCNVTKPILVTDLLDVEFLRTHGLALCQPTDAFGFLLEPVIAAEGTEMFVGASPLNTGLVDGETLPGDVCVLKILMSKGLSICPYGFNAASKVTGPLDIWLFIKIEE